MPRETRLLLDIARRHGPSLLARRMAGVHMLLRAALEEGRVEETLRSVGFSRELPA